MEYNSLINKQVLQYLFGGIILLVIANIINCIAGMPFWAITKVIYLDYDYTISTWYSSLLLSVAGFLSYECSVYAKNKNIADNLPFLLFAGLLFFMSCDEVVQFHVTIGDFFARYFDISSKNFARNTAWVWIGGPIIMMLFFSFIFLLRKAFSIVPKSMHFLVLGFASIVLGGVILESSINWLNDEELKWVWEVEIIFEESFEMIGTILISYSLVLWRDSIKLRYDKV